MDDAPYVTSDLEDFALHHSLNYEQTDTLIDVRGNVEWASADGDLRGVLYGHSASEVTHWGYLNLK